MFARPSGLEACVMTRSLLNRRQFFSFVGTLQRQLAPGVVYPGAPFRPLGASGPMLLDFMTLKSDCFIIVF